MNTENRLDARLATFVGERRPAVIPFLTAGHPDLETTARLIRRFDQLGAAAVELGFPYSDSIADGPAIQTSFHRVLARGQRVDQLLDTVARLRQECGLPLVAMVSDSVVQRIGLERFADRAVQAGFDGLIVPDVPVEEAPRIAAVAAERKLCHIMLVATSTPPARAQRIVSLCSGFVYQVAVAGTTGERSALATDLKAHVDRLRPLTPLPVCVGFGISSPEHVRSVSGFADGVIVGSAIVRRITQAVDAGQTPDHIVDAIVPFVEQLVHAA